jgi:hypothetical protein
MRQWLFKASLVLFLLTFGVYALTLTNVSYVGVKLTYVAVPVIVLTGFIAYLTRPKDVIQKLERF